MLEPVANFAQLAVQRLEPARLVAAGADRRPPSTTPGSASSSNIRGRLSAAIDYSAYHMRYATSTDGGVLWSSLVDVVNWGREYVDALQVATNASGAGAAVTYLEFATDKAVRVARFSPKMAPVARRKFRGGRVQLRSVCDDQKLTLVVEAAKGNRQVKPGSILRRASFARRTKGARRVSRRPYRARYVLRRRHARIPVRVVPRRGKARTLRLKRARLPPHAPDVAAQRGERPHARSHLAHPGAGRAALSTLAESDLLAAIVFVIASATDALDGWLARRRSEVTQFGKLMDPLADKLLITSALVSLVALYRLDAWVAMVIIAREFAVTGLRMLAIEQGQVVSASVWGKLKTTTQVRWCWR